MVNDEIIKYIQQLRLSGKSDDIIKSSLLNAGWGVNDIDMALNSSNQETLIKTPKSNIFKKILLLASLIFLIFIAVFIFNSISSQSSIIDKKYNFEFTKLNSWRKVSSRNGSYITLKTNLSNKLNSYVDIRIVPHPQGLDQYIDKYLTEDKTSTLEKVCQGENKEMTFVKIEKINIPKSNSYRCTYQTKNSQGEVVILESNFILKSNEDIVITYLYGQNNNEEKLKILDLLNGFKINSI